MNKYTIRVYQDNIVVKTYENVLLAHIVKFEYLNMLAKRNNIIDIIYTNPEAIIYILDGQIDGITSIKANTSKLYNASKYLQSNIFTMFLFDIETNEYDIIKNFSDTEIQVFFSNYSSDKLLSFSEYTKDTRNIHKFKLEKSAIFLDVFKLNNYINFDYFVGWAIIDNSISFKEFENIIKDDKNISQDFHPRLWWLQQTMNQNINNLLKFLPIILSYCKHTLGYTLSQLPNEVLKYFFSYEKSEIVKVLKTSYLGDNLLQYIEPFIESNDISIDKLSIKLILQLYNFTNNKIISNKIIVELIGYNSVILNYFPCIKINYKKINLPNKCDAQKYCNFFKKNQKKIKVEYRYLIDCLLLLADDNEPREQNIFKNNIYGNFFDVPEHFFAKSIFLKKLKNQKIESKVFVRMGTKILTQDILTDQILVPIPNTHNEKKLESIDNITFNIQDIYPVGNKLYFGDNGYLEILEDAFISFCVQFKDYIIGYFSDGEVEKICLIHNNKIRIFFSESMFNILLGKSNALYCFIEMHRSDENLVIEDDSEITQTNNREEDSPNDNNDSEEEEEDSPNDNDDSEEEEEDIHNSSEEYSE